MTALEQAIELHRELYRSDTYIDRLVARHPPTSLDLNTGLLDEEPAAAIGMNMAGRLLKYVSHPEGYGSDFPWSKALWHLRGWCRRNHRYHMTPKHWRGSLCWQLVYMTVVGKPLGDGPATVHEAARILQYDNPEPVLREALQYIEDRMDDFRAQAERRAREDEGQALICVCGHPWSRHDDPATMFRCTACTCRRYNADSGRRAA
jgi:hypothetical protein